MIRVKNHSLFFAPEPPACLLFVEAAARLGGPERLTGDESRRLSQETIYSVLSSQLGGPLPQGTPDKLYSMIFSLTSDRILWSPDDFYVACRSSQGNDGDILEPLELEDLVRFVLDLRLLHDWPQFQPEVLGLITACLKGAGIRHAPWPLTYLKQLTGLQDQSLADDPLLWQGQTQIANDAEDAAEEIAAAYLHQIASLLDATDKTLKSLGAESLKGTVTDAFRSVIQELQKQ